MNYKIVMRSTLQGVTKESDTRWDIYDRREDAQTRADSANNRPDRDRCGVQRYFFVVETEEPRSPTWEEIGRSLMLHADSVSEALGG
jgi:hypothetical protein